MITITPAGISVDPALVAGEPVVVSVSGFSLAEGAALTLVASACKANYQIATAVLEAGEGDVWTGTLDTATSAAAMFFAGASACESRDVRLELLDTVHRDSLAALCCPLANSALIPALNPQAVPPVYLPGEPGPPGEPRTPSDTTPRMDGAGAAGTATTYARGDHQHPSDSTKQDAIADLATIRSGAAAGATAVQPSALSAYRTASEQDAIDGVQAKRIYLAEQNAQNALNGVDALDRAVQTIGGMIPSTASSSNKFATAADLSAKQDAIPDLATIRSGAAAGATAVQPSAMPAAETWTFVVDDGQGGTTTITKQVAVYAAAREAGT